MAYNDPNENEFDQDMERTLQEHFDNESPDLRAPQDTWERLQARMDEQPAPSPVVRWLSSLLPVRGGRFSPAFAGVAAALVVLVVVSVLFVSLGNEGESPEGGFAAAPTRGETLARSMQAAAPAATAAPEAQEAGTESEESGTTVPAESQGPAATPSLQGRASARDRVEAPAATAAPAAMATSEPTHVPAPAATTAPAAAPAPTEAPAMAMMEESEPTPYPTPVATMAPPPTAAAAQATSTPQAETAMAMMEASEESAAGPRGPAGEAGPATGSASDGSGTPPDTTFRDYGRQPLVAASEDNVSTFSLDTDRTSYHLALNWARNGYEVDPDSVRAEEWQNAFDYEYDHPLSDSEFAIVVDLFPHPLNETMRLVRVAFQAPELRESKPLNVTLVLDASGSMADGNRVDIAREAAESIRQSLSPGDRIAVVHFTTDVIDQYTVEHTRPDDSRLTNSIARLQPHGSTNVQAGLNLGVSLADRVRNERPDAYNYVILLSDGVANVDATDPFGILETAYDTNAENPLRLITIGVGINNYNDPLLEQLAQFGNGWYRYLNGTEQARATFSRDNWLALSTPFADQTRAQITWDAETVEKWRIIGYENRVTPDHTFTENRKKFAGLYSGAATTVLYEIELAESTRTQSWGTLGRVELRWVDPESGESRSQTAPVSGNPRVGFEGRSGSLAHFGAIVALSADLYSQLPGVTGSGYSVVYSGLSELLKQLGTLRPELGGLEAYADFRFLLEHITEDVEERQPASLPSGYSR